jgi:phosphate starvation-inducible protein PhoH and related proteins
MGRRSKRGVEDILIPNEDDFRVSPPPRSTKPVEAMTEGQGHYIKAINGKKLVFGLGPAGTGKTFIATAMAADALKSRQIKKIILTRPAVEAGEKLGFLPGEMDEKFDPYFRPVRDILNKRLGHGYVDCAIKSGKIEAMPLAFMRGWTFEDCWVILDEAQNTTPGQMKMFITRMGENCKMVVDGDPAQKDIMGPCGLIDAVEKLHGHADIGIVRFTRDDVVRSGLVQDVLQLYEDARLAEAGDITGVLRTLST